VDQAVKERRVVPGDKEIERMLYHALSRQVVLTACRISLIVGSLLAAINHGPALVEMNLAAGQWLQIGLTYFVPYGVSTYSSVKVLLNGEKTA
jgi:hypothetical protein